MKQEAKTVNVNILGEQIAKFRKARSLTQEELGKAVGVSTQAVSRWECGGAPDVSLLPAIADTLGVDIDALFGREGGGPENFDEVFHGWLKSQEQKELLPQLTRLMWQAMRSAGIADLRELGLNVSFDVLNKCEASMEDERNLIGVQGMWDGGLILGVMAQDMAFMSVYPEPAAGYGAYFDTPDHCRRLFSALAQPGAVEVVLDLMGVGERFVLPVTEAKRLGISEAEAQAAMEALAGAHVLTSQQLELADGLTEAYQLEKNRPLVPFFYLARMVGQKSLNFCCLLNNRPRPWLEKQEEERT